MWGFVVNCCVNIKYRFLSALLAITTLVSGIGLAVVLIYDHVQDEKHIEELQAIMKQQRDIQQEQKLLNDSFYQKLADGMDVNLLIVGDSIGAGVGASDTDHGWARLLAEKLQSRYGSNVTFTNISMGGNTSFAGYVRTQELDDDINYDLAIICYGQNDDVENFGIYYESIIRAIKNRCPNASIVCIQESSQRDYTEKMLTIQNIANHYGFPVVDTIAPFQANYDNYVSDGIHPNDEGHKVYCETIMDVIDPLVIADQKYGSDNVEEIDKRVEIFDKFQWLPVDEFVRDGNSFILTTKTSGVILGMDYYFTSGENRFKIYIDGVEYTSTNIPFNYDFRQRYIMSMNNWINGDTVDINNEIKVVFEENESGTKQADGFNGLIIIG